MRRQHILWCLFSLLLITCKKEEKDTFDHPFLNFENGYKQTHWVDVPGMICRDSSPTGVGVRMANTKKLAIYINGGGACFNAETCAGNPFKFTESDWTDLQNNFGSPGIFNPDDDRNPLKDFSLVFIPYCTGDVHSGTLLNGKAIDVPGKQRYVGAINFQKAMDFIEPYFQHEGVDEIVLFGLSAGGYGVYINFLEVIKRFPGVKITVINDSGPLFSDAQAFSPCLQAGFTLVFGLPLPKDLLGCCGNPALGLANVYEYSGTKYPDANFGFISSYEDATSRFFLSFGYDNCQGAPGNQLPADVFRNALINLTNDVIKPKSTWSTFFINGTSHTMLADDELFYNKEVNGMYLYEWVDKLMKGERLHVSE